MISPSDSSSDGSHKVHWTLVLALGWLLAHSSRLADPMIPAWGAFVLIFGTLGLMLLAGTATRLAASRLGLAPSMWSIGPHGYFLPQDTRSLPRRSQVWLAATAPAVYLAAGIPTLPFLVQAGGLEGLVAAWDWWSWPAIAARLSIVALALAAIQLVPVFPLSGGYLLEAIVGNRRMACHLAQVVAIAIGGVLWHEPLVLSFAIYFLLEATFGLRRTNSVRSYTNLTPNPLSS